FAPPYPPLAGVVPKGPGVDPFPVSRRSFAPPYPPLAGVVPKGPGVDPVPFPQENPPPQADALHADTARAGTPAIPLCKDAADGETIPAPPPLPLHFPYT